MLGQIALSGIGCNYINLRTYPVYLIAADRVPSEIEEIPRLVISLSISDNLSQKFVDYSSHCTCIIKFLGLKWIDVKLQLLEVLDEFHTVVLTTPNLHTLTL